MRHLPPSFSPGRSSQQRWIVAVAGYMKFLRGNVPILDDVIAQYMLEALEAFNREAYFAAAVMIGAASEKAVYLLAASLMNVLRRRADLPHWKQR
jgi:hypothetical protein